MLPGTPKQNGRASNSMVCAPILSQGGSFTESVPIGAIAPFPLCGGFYQMLSPDKSPTAETPGTCGARTLVTSHARPQEVLLALRQVSQTSLKVRAMCQWRADKAARCPKRLHRVSKGGSSPLRLSPTCPPGTCATATLVDEELPIKKGGPIDDARKWPKSPKGPFPLTPNVT